MPKLVKNVDGVVVQEYPLNSDEIWIGRSPDNQIQLDDSAVSGSHARIQQLPSAYLEGLKDVWLEDNDSTNGTKINGRAVTRERLKHGDVIRIGSYQLEYIDESNLGSETTRLLLNDTHN